MMTTNEASCENDVLYEFALSYEHPDPQKLDDFVRCHPRHADALTLLALELALEGTSGEESDATASTTESDAEIDAVLSRAMSRFENRLYVERGAQAKPILPASSHRSERLRDPFASRSTEQIHVLVTKLDASPLFVMRLRDQGIREETMTPGFIRKLADVMEEPEIDLTHFFAQKQQIQAGTRFRSAVTPTAKPKMSFEEAVRTSGLSPEQQAYLLSL